MRLAWLALALCCVVVSTRSAAFVHASMDTDEGLYLIMAREILGGHLPYAVTWDCQPPGAYLIWTPFVALFGATPAALRVGADIAVVATSLALYRIGNDVTATSRVGGILAASFYAAMTLDSGGLGSNLELAGAPFVAWALALSLDRKARGPVVGGLLGCAVLIKASLALDAAFVFAIACYVRPLADTRGAIVALAFGALLPLVATVLAFGSAGQLPNLIDATVGGISRHATGGHRIADPQLLRRELLAFLPLTLAPLALPFVFERIRSMARERRAELVVVTCWLACDIAAVWIIHEFFEHQFLAAMLPASVLCAWFVVALCSRKLGVGAALAIAAICLLAHAIGPDARALGIARERARTHDWALGDETSELAKPLLKRHPRDAELFVVDDVPMFYALANVRPPTRYAFPPVFYDPQQRALTGIDTFAEMRRVFATRPRFVMRDSGNAEDPSVRRYVDAVLARGYRAIAAVKLRTLYERDAAAS